MSFQPNPIRNVYITAAGAYLPGEPVDNDRMENVLGLIDGKPSRLKKRILKSNGIKTRHYALDEDGQTTELNEELAAKAVHAALAHSELTLDDVEMQEAWSALLVYLPHLSGDADRWSSALYLVAAPQAVGLGNGPPIGLLRRSPQELIP